METRTNANTKYVDAILAFSVEMERERESGLFRPKDLKCLVIPSRIRLTEQPSHLLFNVLFLL